MANNPGSRRAVRSAKVGETRAGRRAGKQAFREAVSLLGDPDKDVEDFDIFGDDQPDNEYRASSRWPGSGSGR